MKECTDVGIYCLSIPKTHACMKCQGDGFSSLGVTGFIVVDMPPEEAIGFRQKCRKNVNSDSVNGTFAYSLCDLTLL